MKIVMISGKQGSGKTTLSRALLDKWVGLNRGDCLNYKFADVLYEMHGAVLDVLSPYWPDRGIKKDGPLLQLLGTEWGRNTIDQNIWVKVLRNKIKSVKSDTLIIIDDCRFENEFDGFPEALRVRLECSKENRKRRCEMWRDNDTHPSEVGLDTYSDQNKFDLYISTDILPTSGCVDLVIAQLDKNVWQEKRKGSL